MKLNLVAPINDTGYGVAGLNFFLGLTGLGHDVALIPIGPCMPPRRHAEACRAGEERGFFYDDEAPSVRIWLQRNLAEHVGRGPRVGYPFLEIDPLKPGEVHHMRRLDVLVVSSGWARELAVRCGVDREKIRVVPLGVDRSVFHEGVVADRLDPDTTVFFNVGKWEVRKGHDLLCSAFNRAFGRSDKVALRLLTYNQYLGEAGNAEWAARYKGSKLGDRITIYPKLPTQADVARFMMAGDVGVFPARSEGWNLDLLEALSLGKHVIATDYSAHTEFCGPHNAALIPVREMVPANDGWWFHGEGTWADPDEDVLVEHMRAAHRLKQAGGSLANAAGIATAKALSWENAAARLAEAVPAT